MKQVFIKTENYTEFAGICDELISPDSAVGPSMAMVTGRAGRGKTEASRFYAVNTDAVYVRTLPVMSPLMVLREIAFELSTIRPYSTAAALSIIDEEMAKRRRLVLIDEADLIRMDVLETLRGINERCGCPVVLIGEEDLAQKVASRRRIHSRIRHKMVYRPITQVDIAMFYAQALGVEPDSRALTALYKRSKGDWRPMVKSAADIERAMRASGLSQLTYELVEEVMRHETA